jgi:hypothetical protein
LLVDSIAKKINNIFMLSNQLLAQTNINLNSGVGSFGQAANITPDSLVRGIVLTLLVAAAIIFFIMLLVGGVKYILSGGDKGKTEAARGQITAALIGLVIVFAAWAILQLMAALIGLDLNTLQIPTLYGTGGGVGGGI